MSHAITVADVLEVIGFVGAGLLLVGVCVVLLWFAAQGWDH